MAPPRRSPKADARTADPRTRRSRTRLTRFDRLRIDQHPWIEHTRRIKLALGGAKRGRKQFRALAVVPGPVIAADGMMMGDRAASLDQRVACGIPDRLPLFNERAMASERVEREIRRRPVRIDVGEAAGHLASDASRLQNGTLCCGLDLVVEAFEAVPGDCS